MAWSEDRLHKALTSKDRPACLAADLGHDAAVLKARDGRFVSCLDQLIEGVHFTADTPAKYIGAKAVGRVLSDLAATAATPLSISIGLCAEAEASEAHLRNVLRAADRRAAQFGARLTGGDLAAAPGPLRLAVHGLGLLPAKGSAPHRKRGRAGQVLVLTGPTGGSLLGRHLRIQPRIQAGRGLWEAGATAMMDVSDGLAWDLYRLARSSGVAIELDQVPIHRDARRRAQATGAAPLWHALHDGEDHELFASLPKRAWLELQKKNPAWLRGTRAVGTLKTGRGLRVPDEEGKLRVWKPTEGGWRHGE